MDDPRLKIVLRCADLVESRRFYGDVLGLQVIDQWQEAHGDGCVLSVGDGLLELGELRSSHTDPDHSAFDIQISIPDLDTWLNGLDGRWEHTEPRTQPWGERTVRLRDPDGILITVYEVMNE